MLSRLAITSTILATLVQAGPVIQVSPQTKYQQYDGTGISEAFQRSVVIHELNLASEKIVLDYLFSNTTGAGFTILRRIRSYEIHCSRGTCFEQQQGTCPHSVRQK
jgi:O-glycosyl hydrolase